MTRLRLGTASDSNFDLFRSGIKWASNGMIDRGALYGRLISDEMIKCEAARCVKADVICSALKAGFNGTLEIRLILFTVT